METLAQLRETERVLSLAARAHVLSPEGFEHWQRVQEQLRALDPLPLAA